MGLRQIAIEHEERHFAVLRADRASHVEVWDLPHPRNFITGRLDQQVEHGTAGKLQCPTVRIVDRLPEQTIRVSHDRSDDVDQLSQTRQLHAVGVADQRIENPAHQQPIFQVVDLFQ